MVADTAPSLKRFRFSSFDGKDDEKPAPALKAQQKAPESAPAAAAMPMPLPLQLPAITEKDVQAARAEAQAAGNREGYAAAQAKFDKEAASRAETANSLLEVIANRITLAAESHASSQKDREKLMAKLVIAAARKVAGDALKREPYAGVESLLRECMNLIAGQPKITVVASAALAPGLKQRIDTLKPMLQGFTGEIVVEEDAALLDQDCRVEWTSGYGGRDTEALWYAIESIIAKTNVQG